MLLRELSRISSMRAQPYWWSGVLYAQVQSLTWSCSPWPAEPPLFPQSQLISRPHPTPVSNSGLLFDIHLFFLLLRGSLLSSDFTAHLQPHILYVYVYMIISRLSLHSVIFWREHGTLSLTAWDANASKKSQWVRIERDRIVPWCTHNIGGSALW